MDSGRIESYREVNGGNEMEQYEIPLWTRVDLKIVQPAMGLHYEDMAKAFARLLWEHSASGFVDVLTAELKRIQKES